MASGKIVARGDRLKRSGIVIFTTVFLIITLAFSPVAMASQTPESAPVVPPTVDNPVPEEPTEDEPAPDPIVPDPDVSEIPPTTDPEPGESENSPEPEPDPEVPTESSDSTDSDSEAANPDVPAADETGGDEDGVGDGSEPDPSGSDDTNGEIVESGDGETENEVSPDSPDDADGADQVSDEDDPAATPTEEPEPTEAPVPVVTWNQLKPVSCELHAGSSAQLALNDSSTYRCVAAVNVSSDRDMPTDMQIQWQVDVDFPDAYSFGLPEGSRAAVLSQVPGSTATATQIILTLPWQVGSATQSVEFDIVLTRTTCVVGEQVMTVQAVPEVSSISGKVEISQEGAISPPVVISSRYMLNPYPLEVSMLPVDFGEFDYDGFSWGSMQTRSSLTVVNHSECGTEQEHAISLELVSSVPGMTPTVTSVQSDSEGVVLLGGGDLNGSGAEIVLIPEGFKGVIEVDLVLTLAPGPEAEPGVHDMTMRLVVSATP